jgi:O-antigen ligase
MKFFYFKNILFSLLILLFISGQFSIFNFIEVRLVLAISLIILSSSFVDKKIFFSKEIKFYTLLLILYSILNYTSFLFSQNINISFLNIWDLNFLIFMFFITLYFSGLDNDKLLDAASKVFIFVGMLYSILVTTTSIISQGRGTIIFGGPNVATRIIFISSIFLLINAQKRKNSKIFPVIILNIIAIILLGSRGGIIGAFIVYSLYLLKKIKKIKIFHKKTIYFALISLIIILPIYEILRSVIDQRIVYLLIENIYLAGRDGIYSNALNAIDYNPFFGSGLNSYRIYYNDQPYAHNIILEIILDFGFVGLIIFFPLILYPFYIVIKKKSRHYNFISLILIYLLVVSMVSGNFYDFRFYYFFSIVLINQKDYGSE